METSTSLWRCTGRLVAILVAILSIATTRSIHAQEIKSPDRPQIIENETYGFRYVAPDSSWLMQEQIETGASYLVTFQQYTTGHPVNLYIVIQNNWEGLPLGDWLALQETMMAHPVLLSSRSIERSGTIGIERVYKSNLHGKEEIYVAHYYARFGKVYILNWGAYQSQLSTTDIDYLANGFEWLSGEYPELVPELTNTYSYNEHDLTAQVTLQFPFCGSWRISNGYYTDPNQGHANNQYNRYALDFINNAGSTAGQPQYATHSGNVTAGWDPTGGGNALSVYNTSTERTLHLHLSSYTVTSGFVRAGDEVGKVGSTGCGTCGAHIHLAYLVLTEGWWSQKPEPMSGETGFLAGQVHTRNCNSCCGCALAAQVQNGSDKPFALFGEGDLMSRADILVEDPQYVPERVTAHTEYATTNQSVTEPFVWQPASDADGTATGYHVYWGDDPEGEGEHFVTEHTFLPDERLTEAGIRYMRITAEDNDVYS